MAVPKIPSNLAATKAIPGSLMASAKVWLTTSMPPVLTVSVERNPDKLPEPYLGLKIRGFIDKVEYFYYQYVQS